MASHGATPGGTTKDTSGVDPFTRKSSVKKVVKGTKKQQGSSRFKTHPIVELQPLSLLKDAVPQERQELFIKKLQQCCTVFDFMDPVSDLRGKEVKRGVNAATWSKTYVLKLT